MVFICLLGADLRIPDFSPYPMAGLMLGEDLTPIQWAEVTIQLEEFKEVCMVIPGRTILIEHRIILKPGCPILKGYSRIPA